MKRSSDIKRIITFTCLYGKYCTIFISIFCFSTFIIGCAPVAYYNLIPPNNLNTKKVNEVISKLTNILKKKGFEITDEVCMCFYGITGIRENDVEFILKFKHGIVNKMGIFRDEYYEQYIYVLNRKKALTIVTFSSDPDASMDIINSNPTTILDKLIILCDTLFTILIPRSLLRGIKP